MSSPSPDAAPRVPLCVDLDGTLITTDLLLESTLAFVRSDPRAVLRLPG